MERSLCWSGWLTGVSEAGAESTEKILKGPFQFRERFVFSTMASVSFLEPWWTMEAKLSIQTQPPAVKGGERRGAAMMGAFPCCSSVL